MRDKIEKVEKIESADEEILEEVSEEVEAQEENLAEKMHRVNVRWPWLKILGAVLIIGAVVLGTVGMLQSVGQRTEEMVEVGDGEQADLDTAGEEAGEMPEEENKGGEASASESESEPEAPKEEKPEVETPKTEAPQPVTVPQNTGRKVVALTFDDGPSASTTGRLLDILAAKQVKVTFFVLGNMAQKSPEIVKRQVAEGHEVESHTLSHQNLVKLSGTAIQGEIGGADDILRGITGSPAKLVRPPYGSINDTVRANVGKPMILWTVDPEDWKYRNAATVRANVVSKTFDGAIVLMHDIHGTTVDAVGAIIDDLRTAGYEFLTVSEMAAERGVVMQNGVAYGSFRL